MIYRAKRPPLTKVTATAMLCLVIVALPAAIADSTAFNSAARHRSVRTPERVGLAQALTQFRSRIALAQVALNLGHQDLFSQGTLTASQPVGGAISMVMVPSDVPNNPTNHRKAMPKTAGCSAGMMGQMAAPVSASIAVASGLPGFPGASHLYHVGATGFFLEYSDAIKLTMNQQAALNAIKETSIANQASTQRQIDQAEQDLWILTSSAQPDSLAIETKVRAIESLKSEQRITFIRSVGEAARTLSKDQRGILLGTISPVTVPMPAAPNHSLSNVNSRDGAKPKSTDELGDM